MRPTTSPDTNLAACQAIHLATCPDINRVRPDTNLAACQDTNRVHQDINRATHQTLNLDINQAIYQIHSLIINRDIRRSMILLRA